MLSVQNEQCLKSMDDLLILGHGTLWSECHLQEVSDVAQARIRLHNGLALEDPHAGCSNGWHLANHPVNVYVSFFL